MLPLQQHHYWGVNHRVLARFQLGDYFLLTYSFYYYLYSTVSILGTVQ